MDKNMLTSGNEMVDSIGTMNFSGNVIPNNWYNWVLRDNGKPNHLAILLLGEIVYWYRPVEIRDEETGKTTGIRTKFCGDCLRKSYEQLGRKFGEEKHTVKRAMDCLEELGVIKREFRSVTVGEEQKILNNVMHIHLIPEGLRRITYESADEGILNPVDKSVDTLPTDLSGGCVQICGEAPDRFVGTNTKNTTETTYGDSYPIHLAREDGYAADPEEKMDRMDEISTYRDLVKKNIEYEYLRLDCREESDREQIDEIYELICEVVCMTDGTVRIGGQNMPYQIVKSMFLKLRRYHIEYMIESMKKTITEVRNMHAYLITALFRAPQTFQSNLDQRVRHDMYAYAERMQA